MAKTAARNIQPEIRFTRIGSSAHLHVGDKRSHGNKAGRLQLGARTLNTPQWLTGVMHLQDREVKLTCRAKLSQTRGRPSQ